MSEPIRNLKAFMKSYIKSDSCKRALTRPQRMQEKVVLDRNDKEIKYREYSGSNQLAQAMYEAFDN